MIIHNKPKELMILPRPGAPKGGRWHWFRWCFLNSKLKTRYELIFDYTENGYVLARSCHRDEYTKRTGLSRKYDWEIFSVERTSKQCYRCTYTDVLMGKVKYFTAKSPEKLIRKMEKLSKTSIMSGEDNRK